jgi:hypothetical protein
MGSMLRQAETKQTKHLDLAEDVQFRFETIDVANKTRDAVAPFRSRESPPIREDGAMWGSRCSPGSSLHSYSMYSALVPLHTRGSQLLESLGVNCSLVETRTPLT